MHTPCPLSTAPRHRAALLTVATAVLVAMASPALGALPAGAAGIPRQEVTNASAALLAPPPMLFVANYDSGYVSFYPLTDNGNVRPQGAIHQGLVSPQGLCFDSSGNLWVGDQKVVEYAKGQLFKSVGFPGTEISLPGGPATAGLVFDPAGDLWVAGTGDNTVVEFTKGELAKQGSPAPKVILSGGGLNDPFALAFDHSGDLWLSNEGSGNVFEYTKNKLSKSGTPDPKVNISTPGAEGLAFDSSGNLWLGSGAAAPTVVEYAKSQLTKSGSPTPNATIYLGATTGQPEGVTFDSAGDLWVASLIISGETGTVTEFTKAELAKSGSPTPRRQLTGPNTGLRGSAALAIEP
jgi:sugar lactone lactonase YvrE